MSSDSRLVGDSLFAGKQGTSSAPAETGSGWSLVTSPNVSTAQGNYLNAVTCTSASQCWAVGYSINGGVNQTLIEQWNGTSWSVVTSPNSGTANNVLSSVACASATQCWAVGYYFNGSTNQTLIELWDGTSWSIITSADHGANPNYLYGVTCSSLSDCWAVGYYGVGPQPKAQTLIEQFQGMPWAVVSSPNNTSPGPMSTLPNYFLGVTCPADGTCWAVGYYNNSSAIDQTLIERLSGMAWSIAGSPNSGMQNNHLNSVTCTSTSDCWAVGYYLNSSTDQTLTEHWNGNSWAVVSSPNSGTQNTFLNSVTCNSASDCWAVGYVGVNGGYQTLTEHWDGTAWSVVSSPDNGAQNNVFNGVTCTSVSQCWAVGYYNSGSADQTLIEEYSPTNPPLLGVVSSMSHGSTGTFTVNLPLTGMRGIECRSSAALGAGNYSVVFSFVNNVTSCGSAGTAGGSVSSGPLLNQCTENLTGVPNAQYTTVALNGVLDSQNNTGNVAAPMGVLIGDINGTGRVDAADVSLVRQQTLQPISASNFREDINASGRIDASDVSTARQQTLTSLPSPP